MINDLSEESTPEAIHMARGLPHNIYAGKTLLLFHMSFIGAKVPWSSFEGALIRSVTYSLNLAIL